MDKVRFYILPVFLLVQLVDSHVFEFGRDSPNLTKIIETSGAIYAGSMDLRIVGRWCTDIQYVRVEVDKYDNQDEYANVPSVKFEKGNKNVRIYYPRDKLTVFTFMARFTILFKGYFGKMSRYRCYYGDDAPYDAKYEKYPIFVDRN